MIYLQLQEVDLLRILEWSPNAIYIPQYIGMAKCVLQTAERLHMTDKTIKTDAPLDLYLPVKAEQVRFRQDAHMTGVPLLGRMLDRRASITLRAQRNCHNILWHSPTSGRPSFLNVSSLAV